MVDDIDISTSLFIDFLTLSIVLLTYILIRLLVLVLMLGFAADRPWIALFAT